MMKKKAITCIILDDEPASVNILRSLLAEIQGVEVLGSFSDIQEAENQLIREIPDLIFLDIHMPGKSGLELHDEWRARGINSEIAFVTAFDQYAIAAIRKSASDYLLKPVDPQELRDCLLRVRCRIQAEPGTIQQGQPQKLRFNTRSGCLFIEPDDILYIHADVNYSHIFRSDGTMNTVTVNLGKIEELIDNPSFIRITRSLLVNSNHIKEVKNNPPKVVFDVDNSNRELSVPRGGLRGLVR